MATPREVREAELRKLIQTNAGQNRLRELYKEITGEVPPIVQHVDFFIKGILNHEYPSQSS